MRAEIGDLPIYYSGAPGPKAIVVLPEVWGWAGRLKGICDTLAAEGFFVVMPDIHRGDTADGKEGVGWLKQYPYDTVVGPDIARVMDWLQRKGATRIGAMGFCWGGWALAKASASGIDLRCGVGPHPSIRLESLAFAGDEAAMMRQVQMPILMMPAGTDPPALKPGGKLAEIVAAKGGDSIEFGEMQHGWTTRGDLADPAVKRDVEEALRQALSFFQGCL